MGDLALSFLTEADPGFEARLRSLPPEPFAGPGYLRALRTASGAEPAIASVRGASFECSAVLVVSPAAGDRGLARSADYGGPHLSGGDRHAAAARSGLDALLRTQRVVSEVTVFSPWSSTTRPVLDAWGARPEKAYCVLELADPDELRRQMSSGRRYDLGRAERESEATVVPFDAAAAGRFGARYASLMEERGASERWRLTPTYFEALAAHAADALVAVECIGTGGGSAVLYLVNGPRSAYLHSVRWGDSAGATTLANWHAFGALWQAGVCEVNLGGGVTTDPADSLLAFKRSFGGEVRMLYLAGRALEPLEHERAVRAGLARPLPEGSVVA
ncbi:MAG TPA: hypothetical protein VN781_08860 [Acidimicrobiales bacterium]|nr:hypothetical protein [Acidimicrobiales bacterium]